MIKVNVSLEIKMCSECPFYNESFHPICLANKYINNGKEKEMLILDWDDIEKIPSICPLLKLEETNKYKE